MIHMISLGLLAVLCIGLAVLLVRRSRSSMILANIGEGTHGDGRTTKLTDAAIAIRFIFGKTGTDAAHVAAAGAGDNPFCIISDEASAAELPVACRILGNSPGTGKLTLGGTVAVDDEIVPTAGGTGIKLPTASGTYYPGARALQAGVSGDTIEVAHYMPVKRVVP
jgi:hypothetical protein